MSCLSLESGKFAQDFGKGAYVWSRSDLKRKSVPVRHTSSCEKSRRLSNQGSGQLTRNTSAQVGCKECRDAGLWNEFGSSAKLRRMGSM